MVCFFGFLVCFFAWGWCIDTDPPITYMSLTLDHMDRADHVMFLRAKYITNRYCGGTVDRFARDGILLQLGHVDVPPEGFWTGHKVIRGEPVEVVFPVPIPDYLDHHFIYKSEIDYVCNIPQAIANPIRVIPPFVEVKE